MHPKLNTVTQLSPNYLQVGAKPERGKKDGNDYSVYAARGADEA